MSKLYLVDIGYYDNTVIYELVPREIARLRQEPLVEIERRLDYMGAKHLVVDAALPREKAHLQGKGFNVISGRLPNLERQHRVSGLANTSVSPTESATNPPKHEGNQDV